MKPEQMVEHLKELAEKLGIDVSEQNFATAGVPVRSGYCKVKEQQRFIIDKHLTPQKKAKLLAAFLSRCPIENIFVLPKVREFLESNKL